MSGPLGSWDDLASVTLDDCRKMYPGFRIACEACGAERVAVRNTLGFSETSGGWGEITLECAGCGQRTEIASS